MTALLDYDASTAETLRSALGADTVVLPTFDALRRHLDTHLGEDAVVIGASVDIESALALASTMRVNRPSMGVVMVRRRVDTSVLADALRSGVREVVEERDLAGINAAVARVKSLATSLRETVPGASGPGEADEHGRLVTVFSAKGGCGKTTLSTNLAVALTEGGRNRVCLVDLDLSFGDVAIALQLFPAHTIVDAYSPHTATSVACSLWWHRSTQDPTAESQPYSFARFWKSCAKSSTTSWWTPRRPSMSRSSRHSIRAT
jgi:pilus assembly protein CpaE